MIITRFGLAAGCVALASALAVQKPIANGGDDENPLPLIIWHGLGDKLVVSKSTASVPWLTCRSFQAEGLKSTGDLAEEVNPGTYVYFVRLADDASGDRSATFFGNMTVMMDKVCAGLKADPILSTAPAVNALGFSQGGQFLRGYIERCNDPPVANLVTLGSQHNGIAQFQDCGASDWLCKSAEYILRSNTWSSFVQNRVVPAQYYRDPEDLESYLEYSNFLADINNERQVKNATYRENLKMLKKFAMYVFEDDVTVVPKQSGWFSEYNATSEEETKLQNRTIYKEDWLGLKWLDERGRLDFKTAPGAHMQLKKDVLVDAYKTYFSEKSSAAWLRGPAAREL